MALSKRNLAASRGRARRALRLYEDGTSRESVTDLLSDLRHLCEAADIDFHSALDMSYTHYLEERRNG